MLSEIHFALEKKYPAVVDRFQAYPKHISKFKGNDDIMFYKRKLIDGPRARVKSAYMEVKETAENELIGLTPPGTYNPNACGRDACRGSTDCGPEHQTDAERRASLNVWSAQCEVHRKRQGHTPSPRIKMKIADPTGIRTRAA